jgi:predicted small lipoprotein YifL
MKTKQTLARAGALAVVACLAACGSDGPGHCPEGQTGAPPNCVPIAPQTQAAAITAVGSGALVIHPSADSRFSFALEAPIRITETGGGSAVWEFARMSIFRKGAEIERYELGSDVIANAGYSQIAAKSDKVYTAVFRVNSEDFDRVDITLGFGDLKDSRQFTAVVPSNSFPDVTVSLTALAVPPEGTVRLGGR